VAAAAVGLAVMLLLAACSGDDEAGGDTSTTTEPPASETTAAPTTLGQLAQAEADVRAAYEAYWAMSERLAAAPDPEDPEIAELTTGTAREALTTLLTQFVLEGHVVEFQDDYAHEVLSVEVDGAIAHLRDCNVDHAIKSDRETGTLIDEATGTLLLDVRMVEEAGSWKVDQLDRVGIWDGVVPCV
jgi:hypothetical protein